MGHNGAGKTTLMSILTGIMSQNSYCILKLGKYYFWWGYILYLYVTGVTSQTEGNVFINGKNIVEHLETIRNDLGLCPQENMVFPDLNVFEQIEFMGMVRITILIALK